MADALEQLKARFADIQSITAIAMFMAWDQRTMMPANGVRHRADHLSLMTRLGHKTLTDPEIGRLLDEAEKTNGSLDPDSDDYGLLRLARRMYDKAVRVPAELRAEMVRASAEANGVWLEAKATSNFELFLPTLEKQLELRKRYIDCFEPAEEPYDILLDDYEPEMKTATVTEIFDEYKAEVGPLIAELRDRDVDDSFLFGHLPIDKQIALDWEVVDMFGHRSNEWRIDPTEHPFASGTGNHDIRITTHYYEDSLKSLFSTMHEYGHGIYEHQIPDRISHLPIGDGCSLGLHESQSRLWENLVGRSRPFWNFFYPRLQSTFPDQFGNVDVDRFYAAINKVKPSLIRIRADEVTYGMHVILRFELEQDMINGRVALRDLPQAWAAKMDEYLGVEVPDDANGVLQDTHWAMGSIGYFSTYLLGTIMSVQIWEKAAEDLGDLEDQIERGQFAPLREWLGENVHAMGRKFTPQETLRRATGSTIDAKPYLAYLKRKYGAPVAA